MEKEAYEAPEAKEKEDEVKVQVETSHSVLGCGFGIDIDDNVIKLIFQLFVPPPLVLLRSPRQITSLLLAETF